MSADTFGPYLLAQAETREAYNLYNYASTRLELAKCRERAAELRSQSFESVGKGELAAALGNLTEREREIGIAFARYAVSGRTK